MKPPISHRLWEAQLLKWWGRCGNGVYLTCVCTTRGVKIQPKLSTNVIGWSYIKITSYRSTYNIFADCFLEFLSCWFKNFDFNIGTSYRCKLDYINWSSILNFFFFVYHLWYLELNIYYLDKKHFLGDILDFSSRDDHLSPFFWRFRFLITTFSISLTTFSFLFSSFQQKYGWRWTCFFFFATTEIYPGAVGIPWRDKRLICL